MAVMIGSARISENGTVKGVAGDQTGKECSTQNWYLSNKGWYLLRPINPTVAKKIAKNMTAICSGNVGYSQVERTDLYNKAKLFGFDVNKMLLTPANTDCSEAVRVCLAYAGINLASFTTATEVNAILSTGQFDLLTSNIYCKQQDYLKVGDILVTRQKGHTVVVLSNGDKHNKLINPQLQKGDKGYHVGYMQKCLNNKNIMGGNLKIDNDFGSITSNHLVDFQAQNGLTKDAICGVSTWLKLF